MELTVEHLGAVQFEIKARGLTVISDQPEENGGFNEGMTPPEFLLASLGSCAAYYAVEYLKARKMAPEGTRVHVSAEKVKNPARLDNFRFGLRCRRASPPSNGKELNAPFTSAWFTILCSTRPESPPR